MVKRWFTRVNVALGIREVADAVETYYLRHGADEDNVAGEGVTALGLHVDTQPSATISVAANPDVIDAFPRTVVFTPTVEGASDGTQIEWSVAGGEGFEVIGTRGIEDFSHDFTEASPAAILLGAFRVRASLIGPDGAQLDAVTTEIRIPAPAVTLQDAKVVTIDKDPDALTYSIDIAAKASASCPDSEFYRVEWNAKPSFGQSGFLATPVEHYKEGPEFTSDRELRFITQQTDQRDRASWVVVSVRITNIDTGASAFDSESLPLIYTEGE